MRGSVVAGVLSAGLVAGGALAQDAVQWRVEDGGNGHWYAVARWEQDVDWVNARDWAIEHGAHLATMTSAEEDSFTTSLAVSQPWPNPYRGPYIGAFSTTSCGTNACYEWVTGEPFQFTRWHPGNPDASPACPGLVSTCYWDRTGSQAWQDMDACHSLAWFRLAMIEWSADCNSDGIVDFGQIRAGELRDTNANNIPDCCEQGVACNCPADIDGTGAVNAIDLAIIIGNWGTDGGKDYPQADIDGSGTIDGADLTAVLGSWGPCE